MKRGDSGGSNSHAVCGRLTSCSPPHGHGSSRWGARAAPGRPASTTWASSTTQGMEAGASTVNGESAATQGGGRARAREGRRTAPHRTGSIDRRRGPRHLAHLPSRGTRSRGRWLSKNSREKEKQFYTCAEASAPGCGPEARRRKRKKAGVARPGTWPLAQPAGVGASGACAPSARGADACSPSARRPCRGSPGQRRAPRERR
jgi:hypothetical protein